MKKLLLIIITTFLVKIFMPLNPYIECNKLKIINEITIICGSEYTIEYKEIIPQKIDNGIEYKYKILKEKNSNLKTAINKIENNKYIYKSKAKIKVKNCSGKQIKAIYTNLNLHH